MRTDQLSLSFEQDMFVFYEEKNDALIFHSVFIHLRNVSKKMVNDQLALLWEGILYIERDHDN